MNGRAALFFRLLSVKESQAYDWKSPLRFLSGLLLQARRAAGSFSVRAPGFVGEHPLPGGAAATPFLAADSFDARLLGGRAAPLQRFDLVEQQPAREHTVEALLTGGLTLDMQTARSVEQH